MKNPKTLAIVAGTLVLLAVGFLFMRSPKPIIEIKAEKIVDIGPFPLVNTYVTSFTVLIILLIVAFLATRKIELIPGKLQNVVEAVMEALYNICVNTAGEKNGRRFFPLIATIFVFIWIANWMALLPFFNAIGTVSKVDAHDFHEEAVVFASAGGVQFIKPNQKEVEFEVHEAACASFDEEIAGAKAAGEATSELKNLKRDCVTHERERAIAVELPKAAGLKVDTTACKPLEGQEREECVEEAKLARAEEARAKLAADGKTLGILIPTFRSMNTDINSPLSIAIMAVIFIEFWGITALGFFKYAGKFLNFSSPINFIVGLIEFVAEVARLISFTFRLFGNMLAGEILLLMMVFLIPFILAVPFYALEVFVGVIQAFVFALLTLVFGSLAVAAHDDHGEQAAHAEAAAVPH